MEIYSTQPDDGLSQALYNFSAHGNHEASRNGPVAVLPGPVTIEHSKPWQRVSFSPLRDANPFFHLFESLWMLGGRNDVAFVKQFNSNIANYSDDGNYFNGAYGFRWFRWFEENQIEEAIAHMKNDPTSRRCVIGMWDANHDLTFKTKDTPCNTHIYLRTRPNLRGGPIPYLDLTVCNRSNDAVWGAFGANVVHMSILHEYLAEQMGFNMGHYYQISNNFHLYEKHWDLIKTFTFEDLTYPSWYPLGSKQPGWHEDLLAFLHRYDQLPHLYKSPYFREVIAPLGHAWWNYKGGRLEAAIDFARQCLADDWQTAAVEWLKRRVK